MRLHRTNLLILTLASAMGMASLGCQGSSEGGGSSSGGKGGSSANGGAGQQAAGGNAGNAGTTAGGGTNATPEPDVTGQTTGVQPPSAYVAKVKRLLNGGAPTSEELAMVTANPASLKTLIDTWMTHPTFKAKMLTFFTEAFQQGGNNVAALTDQLPQFQTAGVNSLNSITQTFPLTAWDIVENNRPFTEVATTRKFMANTALLVMLAYADLTPTESNKKEITVYNRSIPSITAPVDLTDSASRKVFRLPDAIVERDATGGTCADPAVINHDNFLRVLLGAYHSANCEPRKLSVPILTEADFSDWRMVEITSRKSSDAPTVYYNIPAMRKASTIALKQPRVGFFSTLAFLARAGTNEDNDFRVTTNQTLIVALGRAFDDEDVTIPVRTAAITADHVAPGSVCYGCHVSLDPMRNYFANDYAFTFRPPTTARNGETSFGFRDVVKDGGDLFTFADTLAKHPDFPMGWTQRMCYWANSQACDEEDPEFLRVKDAFVASKFKWKTLIRELFSSPLVTGATETQTQKTTSGTIVSINRRSHLCADIANRLNLPTLCETDSTLAKFAIAIPDDEYGRGAVAPMQPTEPSLLNSGSLGAACDRMSTQVVDGGANTSRIVSSNVDVSLDFLVAQIIGVPSGDPRFAPLRKILQDHITAARAAKASARDAMRSAFSLACQSPIAAGIGL
jgi:hypothetical protein